MPTRSLHVGVFGAGAIGSYLGARLSAAGCRVTLVGRPWLVEARARIQAIGLDQVPIAAADSLVVSTEAASLADVDVCLVTVKSAATDEAGRQLGQVLGDDAVVLSLQNGTTNVARLRAAGVRAPVIAGMVTFNIVSSEPATFRKATSGPIMVGVGVGERFGAAIAAAGEPAIERQDIAAVQTAKLLLNLNNGLCAATGLSIADSVRAGELRWCFSELIREGLRATEALGMPVGRIGRLAPALVARLLRAPNFIFSQLAGSFMRIDPAARSSTLQDLDRGKPTEIDYLNGEVVALAERAGQVAAANAAVVNKVHALESCGSRPDFWSPQEAQRAIGRALAGKPPSP